MRKLDFISRSPQLPIFRESSNKNNLGGVLFLIFIIILILLAIAYISDFAMNERYKFTYTYIKETNDENLLYADGNRLIEKLNEPLDFVFFLAKDKPNKLLNSSNFEIKFIYKIDATDPGYVEINKSISRKTCDFQLVVRYKCDNTTNDPSKCIRDEDKIDEKDVLTICICFIRVII